MKNIELWSQLLNEVAPGCARSYDDAHGIFWNCQGKFLVIESDEHGYLKIELRSSIFEADTLRSEYLILDGKHVCEMTSDRYERLKEVVSGFWRQKEGR